MAHVDVNEAPKTATSRARGPAARRTPQGKQPSSSRAWTFLKDRNWPFWIVCVGLVVLWEVMGRTTESSLIIVPLSEVVERGVELAESGLLWRDFSTSSQEFLLGFFIGSALGIISGLLSGYFRIVGRVTDPLIAMMDAVPIIALAPIFIVAFGLGITSKVVVVIIACFFSVAFTTTAGVRAIETTYLDLAKVFELGRLSTIIKVIIPSAIPYILSGLRVATGRGVTAVLAAELFGATSGLGLMILNASTTFDTAAVFVGVIIFAFAGGILVKAWYIAERKLAPWRPNVS